MLGRHSSRPRKDKAIKVSGNQRVKRGEILVRGIDAYKAGENVKGRGTLIALCPGEVYFTRKKIGRGKPRTFINVNPTEESL